MGVAGRRAELVTMTGPAQPARQIMLITIISAIKDWFGAAFFLVTNISLRPPSLFIYCFLHKYPNRMQANRSQIEKPGSDIYEVLCNYNQNQSERIFRYPISILQISVEKLNPQDVFLPLH